MATNINLTAPIFNIWVEQGGTIDIPFQVKRNGDPFDMTGYTLRSQVRLNVWDTVVLLNATTQNGKLVFDDITQGTYHYNLAPEDTITKFRFANGQKLMTCTYDLEMISPTGVVFKPNKGDFVVYREVTR